jgi:hypothetical protein
LETYITSGIFAAGIVRCTDWKIKHGSFQNPHHHRALADRRFVGYDFIRTGPNWSFDLNRHEFIDWYEDVRAGTRRLIAMVPDEAFDFQAVDDGPTIEQIMRAFASLEDQYIRGVCTGDWSSPKNPWDACRQISDSLSSETAESDLIETPCELQTSEEILDYLDEVHQNSLDILADLSDGEFQSRWATLPWGDEGTIVRLLLGLVEREIHHRTELYISLQIYGIPMTAMMLWGP